MAFQVVQVNKEDKIIVVTSKTEYTFTPERYNIVIMVYRKSANFRCKNIFVVDGGY